MDVVVTAAGRVALILRHAASSQLPDHVDRSAMFTAPPARGPVSFSAWQIHLYSVVTL